MRMKKYRLCGAAIFSIVISVGVLGWALSAWRRLESVGGQSSGNVSARRYHCKPPAAAADPSHPGSDETPHFYATIAPFYDYQSQCLFGSLSMAFTGRTGNLMFQYASLLGLAHTNRRIPLIPDRFPLYDVFELKSAVPEQENRSVKVVLEDGWGKMDPKLRQLDAGPARVFGYVQSWRYFAALERLVKSNFHFRPHLRRRAAVHMQFLLSRTHSSQVKQIVGVHVRRGDMLYPDKVRYGYCAATCDYLLNAMLYMTNRLGDDIFFLVCTDDHVWTTECLASLPGNATAGRRGGAQVRPLNYGVALESTPESDVALLALHAQHMIITVGSFSWWAAWLVNGTTVYYDRWPSDGCELRDGFQAADYYLPNWVPALTPPRAGRS